MAEYTDAADVMHIWAVVYSNYEPSEVDSLWATRERAEERAEELGDSWRIIEWSVHR